MCDCVSMMYVFLMCFYEAPYSSSLQFSCIFYANKINDILILCNLVQIGLQPTQHRHNLLAYRLEPCSLECEHVLIC